MGKIVISENVSLDGVIQDPAGDEGFRRGGWVGRIAALPEVAKVALDEALGAEERDRLWQRRVAVDPRLDASAVRRSIETPVIVLEPRSRTA